jgi:hypothetical protein
MAERETAVQRESCSVEIPPSDAFARRWNPVVINRFFEFVPGYPEIAEVRKEVDQTTNIGGDWNTDQLRRSPGRPLRAAAGDDPDQLRRRPAAARRLSSREAKALREAILW